MYSEKVKELVSTLPNRGSLPDATHRAEGVNPVCGDELELFLRIENERIQACRYRARGCAAALASAAALSLLCEGQSVQDCKNLDSERLLAYLGGLPRHKKHGVDLALEVLERALSASS